jgi:hypothetical protein
MRVIFNKTEDFMAEARAYAQRGKIDGQVCRVTWKHLQCLTDMTIEYRLCAFYMDGSTLIELEDSVLTNTIHHLQEKGLPPHAVELKKRVAHHLSEMGFEIRGGVIVL